MSLLISILSGLKQKLNGIIATFRPKRVTNDSMALHWRDYSVKNGNHN